MTRTGITGQTMTLGLFVRISIEEVINGFLIQTSTSTSVETHDEKIVTEKTTGHTILMTKVVDEMPICLYHQLHHRSLVDPSPSMYDRHLLVTPQDSQYLHLHLARLHLHLRQTNQKTAHSQLSTLLLLSLCQ
jgi:hypothetical protein